jgi:calcineurin-like phosphoesterase family protein
MHWFIADTHFNHENVIEYSSRPFFTAEGMAEVLIDNWNEKVNKSDTVHHLGDFALSWGKKHAGLIDDILSRLNGNKHLIIGNHDRDEVVKNPRWQTVNHYKELKVDVGGVHKQRIVMSHYAFRTWNQMHRGAIMLHGHSHGNLTDCGGKIMDVGVDRHGYSPVSLTEIMEYMEGRPIINIDHHIGQQ